MRLQLGVVLDSVREEWAVGQTGSSIWATAALGGRLWARNRQGAHRIFS